eukprot:6678277-Prymnesium_polylepis.1
MASKTRLRENHCWLQPIHHLARKHFTPAAVALRVAVASDKGQLLRLTVNQLSNIQLPRAILAGLGKTGCCFVAHRLRRAIDSG